MTKTSPIALDYENTLVLAIELSLGFGGAGSGPAAGQSETDY
jgi:hypothetical protein